MILEPDEDPVDVCVSGPGEEPVGFMSESIGWKTGMVSVWVKWVGVQWVIWMDEMAGNW